MRKARAQRHRKQALRCIATEILGWANVQLFVDPSLSGGCFDAFFRSDSKLLPRITVGLPEQVPWWKCLSILHHECYEYLLAQGGMRYETSGAIANNSADYYFSLNHQQFAEVCCNAAYFISKVTPLLEKAWKASQKANG